MIVTDSMVGSYNNLLAVEMAVFDINTAAISVFVQVVCSHSSYREVDGISRNVFLVLHLVVSIGTILTTGHVPWHFRSRELYGSWCPTDPWRVSRKPDQLECLCFHHSCCR